MQALANVSNTHHDAASIIGTNNVISLYCIYFSSLDVFLSTCHSAASRFFLAFSFPHPTFGEIKSFILFQIDRFLLLLFLVLDQLRKDAEKVKLDIKTWERGFQLEFGRPPASADIKTRDRIRTLTYASDRREET